MRISPFSSRSPLRGLAVAGLCAGALLTGCKNTDDEDTSDPLSEQAASASQSLGMLMDASTETVLGATSGGDSDRAIADPGAPEAIPDLAGRATSSTTIDLATVSVNGQPLFPAGTASGTLTVATSGTAASSWPAGTVTLFTGSVTVSASNVVLTNGNGDSLSIPSGSFSYTLEATGERTDASNWTIATDSLATLSTPLAATLIHGSTSHTVALAGNRQVHQELTRVYTVDSGSGLVTANTRTAARTVSGSTAGTSLSADPAYSALGYTNWAVTIDGATIAWNRNAAITTRWDYLQLGTGNAFSVTSAHDYTFLATVINGATSHIGPFTALQMGALLRARIEAAWL